MRDEFVRLFKRPLVEQELDALARRHLAFFVLALATLRASAVLGQLIALLQFGKLFFQFHRESL